MESPNDQNIIGWYDEFCAYLEEHHLFPDKHTTLYNQSQYFKRKMKEGTLDEDKAMEMVLGIRDLSIHTGGRKRKTTDGKTWRV